MKMQVLLAVMIGSQIVTVVGASAWCTRTQSAQIEVLAHELRREQAALVRIEARLAERRSVQPAAATVAACPPGTELGAGGVEAAVQNAVIRTLEERETSEKLQREAEAQPSPAAEAAALSAETLIADSVRMRVWNDVSSLRFRDLSQDMTKGQVDSLRQRVAVAINEGKMVIEGNLPPL